MYTGQKVKAIFGYYLLERDNKMQQQPFYMYSPFFMAICVAGGGNANGGNADGCNANDGNAHAHGPAGGNSSSSAADQDQKEEIKKAETKESKIYKEARRPLIENK